MTKLKKRNNIEQISSSGIKKPDVPGPPMELSQQISEDGMEIMERNKAYGMYDVPGHKNVRVQVPVHPNEAYSVCKGGTHEDPVYELVN
ncbi:hypothetical protein GBAR_LOCUS5718 [Geodia barretti]|uniref:Uncharacterized protein n=1 Tax=Geodia barretti TaxID=519541 RepID=A0AA35RDW1_GEOBA|nr:hypothetical protein GBAR_LOCUS5718 [Geodia barretti]